MCDKTPSNEPIDKVGDEKLESVAGGGHDFPCECGGTFRPSYSNGLNWVYECDKCGAKRWFT